MTAIIDYGTGNLRSVQNALARLGESFTVTADEALILSAGHVILPGVGEAAHAMEKLTETGLDKVIPKLKCPVLGICIGMQLMCISSEEGDTQGLGIFETRVRRFLPEDSSQQERVKIPHMGWNSLYNLKGPIFNGIEEGTFVYYVHSFAPDTCRDTVAETCYGNRVFGAALAKGNFYGTQFHPEKSGRAGAEILKNFLAL